MLLSICIPTYNRSKYLLECVYSVIKQVQENSLQGTVEICISDNNSSDDTALRVNELMQLSDVKIMYHRNLENIGPDLNYLKCVKISSAKFCWLMGSDDTIVGDSLKKIIEELLNYNADAYISNRIMCNLNLKPYSLGSFFKHSNDGVYRTSIREDLLSYFNNAISLGAIFSFLSSIIVKKEKWDSVHYDQSYTGTAYPHVFIILSYLLEQNSTLKIIFNPIVYCRVGNDSFLENGTIKRFLIDVDGYLKLADHFFLKDRQLKSSFLNILRYENGFIRLLKMRSLVNKNEWLQINRKLENCGFDKKKLIVLNHLPGVVSHFVKPMIQFKLFFNKVAPSIKRLYYWH